MRRSSVIVCPANLQAAAPHATLAHQRRSDVGSDVDADRETDALRAAGDRRVDADDAARAVDERAARVAGIQRCIGLDHALDESPRARAQAAAERADDAGGHGRLVAERIADRDDELSDAQRGGAAESRVREAAAGESQHRDIRFRVVADQRRRDFAAVGQRRAQLARAVGDVAVRQQIAVGRVEHAGADAGRCPPRSAPRCSTTAGLTKSKACATTSE